MPKLNYSKWSGELNVPDPVAISFDNEGRAYVTQTLRRKSQDLDIRANKDWIADDVGLSSVEEKRAFFKKMMPEGGQSKSVADMNGDGSRDWRDLTVRSELIHRYTDTDGDGKADKTHIYADDFKTEVTGIAAGVMWRDGDVYATIAPDVWKLRDTDGDGKADTRELLATGFGMHIAYAGHDMHGLTTGPDGKIYWTVGDKGINVISKEGRHFFYPNQGGVMRCNPDGSAFEVYAHGLRNVQELAFDEYGNLFGVDNDADKNGEKERLVYIAEGMDAGWRCNYQYPGKGDYNPWMDEKLWHTRHAGQAAYITPPLAHATNGPAGFTYNPGTALGEAYRGYFFLTEAPGGKQYAFRVEPDGASFTRKNEHLIGAGIPLVGINFAPDGALYGVDWGGGYPLNETGAIWKIDVAEPDPARVETQRLLSIGPLTKLDDVELVKLLGYGDQRVRLEAQFELVRRSKMESLAEVASDEKQPLLARVHALWGLAQAGADVPDLSADPLPEMRVQFLKSAKAVSPDILQKLLKDDSPRVRYFAAMAVGRTSDGQLLDAVVALLAENDGRDLYLRHAGIMALSGAERLAGHESAEVRLCAVVALRKTASPEVAVFLNDVSESVAAEAARAVHDDLSIPDALPALAASLTDTQFTGEPFLRRAINANLRLGDEASAGRVAAFVANEKAPRAMRRVAMNALRHWVQPPVLDAVDGRRRDLGVRDGAIVAAAFAPYLSATLTNSDSTLVEGAISLATEFEIPLDPDSTRLLVENEGAPAKVRVAALRNSKNPAVLETALESKSAALRVEGAKLLAARDSDRAKTYLMDKLTNSQSIPEQQNAIALLGELKAGDVLKRFASGKVDAALKLDLQEALGTSDAATGFSECLEGGDAKAGEAIFSTHVAAQCIRCHKVNDEEGGSLVGPNLKEAGIREGAYLLESMINPGAVVVEGYRNIVVTLKDGQTIAGIHKKEDKKSLEMVLPDGKTQTVKIDDIATRTPLISTMPPMPGILTKREIRDVMAYLVTLKGRGK